MTQNPKIAEVAVLNSYTATPATVTSGRIDYTGVTTDIPMRASMNTKASSLLKKVYTAGTAQAITVTFTAVSDSQVYELDLQWVNKSLLAFLNANSTVASNNQERYTISSGTSATTTTVAAAFATKITAAIAAGNSALVTATSSTNVLTLTIANANNAFTVNMLGTATSAVATSVAQVVPSLTYTEINTFRATQNNNAIAAASHPYTLYRYTFQNQTDSAPVNQIGTALIPTSVWIFLNEDDADYADAVTAIDAINLSNDIEGV